ncbi:cyanophycinase [Inhella inkyongensis]|uniref:Cyanophycinase n=1 Tax=Inhella inkyongensis TaxID=392593 RepID=A0A840S323_9BURK|nr:cyanophycinase [Inhella inkyongensis]MBB5205607.1 cyanophycinase [Inhella inkyongensis]
MPIAFQSRRLANLWLLSLFCAALPTWAASNGAASGAAATTSNKNYDYYLSGSAGDATPPAATSPMWVLMGGGNDVDSAFQAMIAKAGGSATQKVDVVVIRTSGADGYNPYLLAMPGVDSVESFVIKNRTGADDPALNAIVAKADVLFIAGGDQSTYIKLWKGSRLDSTLKALRDRRVPFGGTSAGLAVLGDVDYSALNGSITSAQALSNPYDRTLTLDTGFIVGLSGLDGTLMDSHLVARDRMGRLATFLARMIQDGLMPLGRARGIGVDEGTAVVVDNRIARVHGSSHAYFVLPTLAPTTVQAKKPLAFSSLRVEKLSASSGSFDLGNWSSGTLQISPYFLSASGGSLTSSQSGGSAY